MKTIISYTAKIWRAILKLFGSSKDKETQQKGIAFAD